jgi:alpha-glucosidase (family GH31 glycosyl hydrolase)
VDKIYKRLKDNNVPMVAAWMQDWAGLKNYLEGTRLMWNWQLNKDFYPNWDESVKEWAKDGVRPFVYINPFFQNATKVDPNARSNQF